MRSLFLPPLRFQGSAFDSAVLTSRAVAWADAIATRLPSNRLAALPISHNPDGVALFFAALSLDRPFVALSPDPAAWPTGLPESGALILVPPSEDGLAKAARGRGIEVFDLPDANANGDLGFLRCPSITTFTSGSTGAPKAVCRPADGVFDTAEAIAAACGVRSGEGVLAALPLGGLHGVIHGVIMASVLRSEATLADRVDHRTLLAEFATGRHAFWAGSPHMAELLTRCALPGPAPRAPRVCRISGSRISAETARRFAARFGARLINAYGTVEHGALTQDVVSDPLGDEGSGVGRPLTGVRVAVGDSPECPFPSGQRGRIWAHAVWQSVGTGLPPHLSPHLERRGEWLPTSDVGFVDAEGCLYVLGRSDDLVKTPNGHLASPTVLEEALASHPGVEAVSVLPMSRSVGARLGAVVEGVGLSPGGLIRHAAERVPEWLLPQTIEVVARLPRLPGGKVDRAACLAMLDRSNRIVSEV